LRRSRPDLQRSFVVPGGRVGVFYVVVAPVLMAIVALLGAWGDLFAMIGGVMAIALGPLVYFLLRGMGRQGRSVSVITSREDL
jgi:hypothetical protein